MSLFHYSKMNSFTYEDIRKHKHKIKYVKAQSKEAVKKHLYNPRDNWLNHAWIQS